MTMCCTRRFGTLTMLAILFISAGSLRSDPIPEELPPINALSAGMGFAVVAVPFNASTIYWNPAGIGIGDQLGVDISIAMPEFEGPGSWSFLLVNSAPGASSRSGMGLIRRSVKRDSLTYTSFQVITPLAYRLKHGILPIGFSLKFISERLEGGKWKYGGAVDFGLLYDMRGVMLGFVARNIAASSLQGFRRESWLGASWGNDESAIVLSGQVKMVERLSVRRMNDNYNTGLRLRFGEQFPDIYLGRIRRENDRWTSMGLGYRYTESNVRLEYSYSYDPSDNSNQVHILTYGFGSREQNVFKSPGKRW